MSQQSEMFSTRKAQVEMVPRGSVLQRSAVSMTPPSARKVPPSPAHLPNKEGSIYEELRFAHDFSQVPVHADTVTSTSAHATNTVFPAAEHSVQRATTDGSRSLDETVRKSLEGGLGHDFSQVRVHQGSASDIAARNLGARAYTLGRDIYLGAEARSLNRTEHNRLLAHEAIHTVQQGGVAVTPQGRLAVSSPTDAAEVEADRIARSVISADGQTPSRSLAQRDRLRATPVARSTISRVAAPLIQRDLKKDYAVKDGTFKLNLKTESHAGAKSGMSGTINFKASDKAPDSTIIRLLQIVRDEDLTTGKEYVWTGGDANRNKVMTTEDKAKSIKPGYLVDTSYDKLKPRTAKGDSPVSPYYIDPPADRSVGDKDGSKKGTTVTEASLYDYPGSHGNRRYSFETTAKAADTGYIYASIHWGFTISDASKGKVEKENADVQRGPSATFGAAVKAFNEFYKNPGASTAP